MGLQDLEKSRSAGCIVYLRCSFSDMLSRHWKGFWGRCKKRSCSPLPVKAITLTSRVLFVGVCVGVCLGGESMIRLLILACLLSKAAWIEETVGHNWLRQLGHDHSPRVEHLKANLHVTLPNYTKKRTKNSERKDILLLLPPTFSFSVYQVFYSSMPCKL